jgi:hypothetical protein
MDPDRDNHSYLVFLYFYVQPDEIYFFKTYANDPDMEPESIAPYIVCIISIVSAILLLFLFLGTATPSIFGNAPWTLQQHPQHCHQPSPIFSDFSPILLLFFTFA